MLKKACFKHIVAFSLPLITAVSAHAFEYQVVTPLSANQKAAVQALLKEADQRLPETLKSALSTVEIRFGKLPSFGLQRALGAASFSRRDLTLDNSTLAEIVKGPMNSTRTDRSHKTMYAEILATVLHETTHLYDFANVHSDSEKQWIERCDTKFAKSKEERIQNGARPYACKYYENMTTSFSKNPYFLQVAGWTGQSENGLNQRSPDRYELENTKEYLAVNMEYFLMDPQYKCRRPGMYKVLSSQFRHTPFQNVTCDQQLGYVIPNSSYKLAQVQAIDPSRVYQIHYLFAEKGSELSSGWGHSMIRLVMCSPQRKVVGPDCLRDIEFHLVLSFRAFVDSLQLNAWAGMVGDYPSRLFILPLNQVIDEYPKGQFRALRSLPLAFTRQQINDFIARSVEIHWGYNGKYKFITNNCATETMDLLQSVLLSPGMMNTEIKTPKGLYDVLLKQGLGNERVFADKKQALELGYYFDSYEERYQKTFGIVKDAGLTSAKDFKQWIESAATYRKEVISMIKKSQPEYKKMTAALFVLELAAQRQIQNYIMSELTQSLTTSKEGKASQDGKQAADNYLELSQLFAKPSAFLPRGLGYGLPDASEMASASAIVNRKAEDAIKISEETKKIADKMTDPALLKEIETSNQNITMLQALLRSK
ncbi:DUF4105 domain-containing protein [Bdellovibrio sp. SKB1291214]|uniref:DUF7844 domain-containing protein n=1 Tax=Bdellovibrio sp. SKB1291214 TaxID=1732569 RepID=UPI000B5199F4|nr:DUF4105 domain-containing protein [Bdellovibrio sp. SKB1291214]UYL10091.1 DUF4105 domain-containing protein [Bdellovibrio sp. SKB1291214]